MGYNWTPDEREVFDRWYANDWAKADEALRIALAASNNPQADSDELRRRLGWFLDG